MSITHESFSSVGEVLVKKASFSFLLSTVFSSSRPIKECSLAHGSVDLILRKKPL